MITKSTFLRQAQLRSRRHLRVLLPIVLITLATLSSNASSNSGITYHGRILKSDGSPLAGNAVQFKMQIRSPGNESCLLYEEVQTLNMSDSSGVFSISLNDGSGTRNDSSGIQFDNVFSNRSGFTLPATTCASGSSYNPNPGDARSFVVSFKDGDMPAYESLPAQPVNFAPTAIQALQIAGFGPTNLLRVDDSTALANVTPLNNAQYLALIAVANGTAPYVSSSVTAGAGLPVLTSVPMTLNSGAIWFNSSTNSLQFYDGSAAQTLGVSSASGTVTSVASGLGLTGGPITTAGTISLATFGTAGTYMKVVTDSTGRVYSGSAALLETDIPNLSSAGKVSGSAITSGTIAGTTAINSTGTLATTGSVTAASVSAPSLSTNSLLLYNSGNTHKVTLVTPALTSDLSLILPMTSGSSGNVLSTDGSGNLSWMGISGAPTGTAGGDLSGTYPNPSVAKLSGTAVSTSSLATGNLLRFNGTAWVNGNLTSSDLPSLSSGQTGILPIANGGTGSSTGSVTGSSALTFTAGGSNQNVTLTPSGTGYTILGGNVGIGISSPAAQLQVAADILAGTKVSIGSSSYADLNLTNNGTLYQNGGDPFSRLQSTGSGNARIELQSNGPSAGATDAGHESGRIDFGGYNGSYWVNQVASLKGVAETTWNSSSTPMALTFATTSGTYISERMRISSSGNVGIGSASPTAKLDVAGSIKVGADATTCSGVIQGAIHLNGANLEFCNGANWLALSSTSGTSSQTFTGDITLSGASTSLTVTNNQTIGGTLTVSGVTNATGLTNSGLENVTNSTASTTPSNGALTVSGGAGVAGALNVGGGLSSQTLISATSSVNSSSPSLMLQANYWNGTASTKDQWTITDVVGIGTNPAATLTFDRGTSYSSGLRNYAFLDGNIGIGTTSPSGSLEVASNNPVQPSIVSTYYAGANPTVGGAFIGQAARGTQGAMTPVQQYDNLGSFLVNGNAGVPTALPNAIGNFAGMTGQATETWGTSSHGSKLFFTTAANGTSTALTRLTIDQTGNVGIGTLSPSTALQVIGTASATSFSGSGSSLTGIPNSALQANLRARSIGYVFDGAGSSLSAGRVSYYTVPFSCTISAWSLTVDNGTATVDVWKVASGTAIPTLSNSITSSTTPAIASGTALHSATLTGWTTAVAANDIIAFDLKAVASATNVSLVLECDQ